MNLRPLGYEPNELPDCSTPRRRLYQKSVPPQTLRGPLLSLILELDHIGGGEGVHPL